MKNIKTSKPTDLDFLILGINCHIKSYKLCWEINKKLNTNFVKSNNHTITTTNKLEFERFTYFDEENNTDYNILSNRSENGHLEPLNKSVNYFLVVEGGIYKTKNIIESLNKIDDVLLVFELNLSKIKNIESFIINE